MNPNLRWDMADTPWGELQAERVVDNDALRYMVCVASFVEITTDLYTRNLIEKFADDAIVSAWLRDEWEPQEMQHGQSLREYIRHVWPDFEWDRVYRDFLAEFSRYAAPEFLLPERSLEMVSRCVVEMGTSSYYTALHRATDEPVLCWLTKRIYQDEISHYKYFLRYFHRYREQDGVTRRQVAWTLFQRLRMIDGEDSHTSIKYVHGALHPDQPWNDRVYRQIVRRCRKVASPYVPHRMSAKMLLRPLDITPLAQRVLEPALAGVARLVA
ncbi:MAG TPA: ferritin-like domain-containing protein [Nevskiaceae bacterium]